jgi:hypothetical protein
MCKKCAQAFNYQYHLMLHIRYFCSFNTNNLLRLIKPSVESATSTLQEKPTQHLAPTPPSSFNKNKRKSSECSESYKKKFIENKKNLSSFPTEYGQVENANNVYTNCFRKIIANMLESDPTNMNANLVLLKQLYASQTSALSSPITSSPPSSLSSSSGQIYSYGTLK